MPDVFKEKSPSESTRRSHYLRRRRNEAAHAASQANADVAYTLYRGHISDACARFHVATFDAKAGEEHNRALCEYAQAMFQAQAPDGQIFWCEKGHYRNVG